MRDGVRERESERLGLLGLGFGASEKDEMIEEASSERSDCDC